MALVYVDTKTYGGDDEIKGGFAKSAHSTAIGQHLWKTDHCHSGFESHVWRKG